MKRILIFALLATSVASADNIYRNQIEVAEMMYGASPGEFQSLCDMLGGEYTARKSMVKCKRGATTMVGVSNGKAIYHADVSYPATPKDVRGLRAAAIEGLGEPDRKERRKLFWNLGRGKVASVEHNDELSSFVVRKLPRD